MARGGGIVRLVALLALVAAGTLPRPALAEVATDGTLGRKVRLTGKEIEVGAELGKVRGKNLFHSFERFGVETQGRVTFTGPSGLDNVISRVTGGEASRIDGTLASRVPGADVWLVNPGGILFGPNARLDVPGSFHASTADEIRFENGEAFSATDPGSTVLSVAAPEAFGFLGGSPGAIIVDRSVLSVPDGEALSLVGGDVGVATGFLGAAGGRVTVAGLGGPGEADVIGDRIEGDLSAGILIAGASVILVTGEGSGSVRVAGGQLVLEQSAILAGNSGAVDRDGRVTIEAGSVLIGAGSAVNNDALGSGRAGEIVVRTGALEVQPGGRITSLTAGPSDAAPISVEAGSVALTGGRIRSVANPGATGDAGQVTVTAESVSLLAGSEIGSLNSGAGDAGAVSVTAGDLTIRGGSLVSAGALASGGGGTLTVTAGRILIARDGSELPTGITVQAEPTATGDAGNATVSAETIEILDGGAITSATFGAGDAGEIRVEAGSIEIVGGTSPFLTGISGAAAPGSSGQAGTVTVAAGRIALREAGTIESSTSGAGDAGTVSVQADEIEIRSSGSIASTTSGGAGAGGAVVIEAGRLFIAGDGVLAVTGISGQSEGGSRGDAGTVSVTADEIELRDGGSISSATFTSGRGGVVQVDAGTLVIVGESSPLTTGITGAALGSGDAGTVTVVADEIRLRDGGVISSTTSAGGAAGAVTVDAGRLTISGDGSPFLTGISSQANLGAAGPAGAVTVRAGDLEIRDEGEIGSSGLGTGPAGDVRLEAGTLLIDDAAIRTIGTGAEGGRIEVQADDLIHLVDARVTSNGIVPQEGASLITLRAPFIALNESIVTSLTGDGEPLGGSGEARLLGDVTVISIDSLVAASSSVETTGLQTDLGSELQVAAGAFLDADSLLGESCAARRSDRASSFTRVGRGGLPPSPDRPLSAIRPAGSDRAASAPRLLIAGSALGAGCG